jgi:hypothetical protein
MYWLISPMPERIEMMGGMITIVEADSIALSLVLALVMHPTTDILP